jgi:hypothetical protein
MPSYVPPKKNAEYIFYVMLRSQANTKVFQVNPTIAAGDFTVSTDGGTSANLTTLPSVVPSGGRRVKITVSATEMNGDNVNVLASDAAGAEWCSASWNIQTSARQTDDLSFPQTSGRGTLVAADGSVSPNWADVKSPTSTVGLSGTTVKTATDVETDTQDIQSRLPAALVTGRMSSDAVAISGSITAADAVEANIGNLDAAVSTRLATAGYTAPDNAGISTIGGIVTTISTNVSTALARLGAFTGSGANTVFGFFLALLKKDAITPSDIGGTFDPATDSTEAVSESVLTRAAAGSAMTLTTGEREAVADALIGRNHAGGSNAGRLVKHANQKLVNRVAIAGGVMTVYEEDDTTPSYTAAVTTTAGDPISDVDPV